MKTIKDVLNHIRELENEINYNFKRLKELDLIITGASYVNEDFSMYQMEKQLIITRNGAIELEINHIKNNVNITGIDGEIE